jgi:hypothetical protein
VTWIVELLDDRVRKELDVLPADMKARFRRIVELIQNYGFDRVREPHVLLSISFFASRDDFQPRRGDRE